MSSQALHARGEAGARLDESLELQAVDIARWILGADEMAHEVQHVDAVQRVAFRQGSRSSSDTPRRAIPVST